MKREEFLLGISWVTCIGFLGYLSEEIGLDNHWLGVIGFNMGILWGSAFMQLRNRKCDADKNPVEKAENGFNKF
jgi:hypothetical protein